MRILKTVLAIMIILVCAQVVSATEPLSVRVNCQGCSTRDGNNFYANAGETITLTVSSTGGIGSKSYKWTKGGILVHDSIDPFPITVTENAKYILTVTDRKGYISKTVKIISVSQEKSKCLPSFKSDIIIDDRRNREKEFSVGDTFALSVRLDTRDCSSSNYNLSWIADDKNIIFVNPNSTRTEVRIGQGTKNGRVEIKAIVTNPFTIAVRSLDTEIRIVSNTPPQFEIGHDEIIYSYTSFNVWASDFEPGERGESGDFLYNCSVILRNEQGIIVSRDSKIARGGKVPILSLKPGRKEEIYSIEMMVGDSHGAITAKTKPIGNIKLGKTGKDIPIVSAPDIIYCVVGEVCKIDASETTDEDKDISNLGFYNAKTSERLINSRGDYCSGPICRYNFTYPGTYKIRIEANYFDGDSRRESKVGSKIVTVVVSPSNVSIAPTAALTPTATPTIAFIPNPVARVRTDTIEEHRKKKWSERIISDISNIIDTIKNALNF